MLTIDWKERLNKDTDDYLQTKLPNRDYDFEIIFIAYPERVNGKIPNEVIVHVANTILQRLGKTHEQYQSFFRYLWTKKGEYGKLAFTQMMSKLLPKKPGLYFPMLEEYLKSANQQELSSVMDKVMLPLLRKAPEKYLDYLYTWSKADNPLMRKLAMNTAIKLIKKVPELTGQVFMHYQHQWYYPLGDMQSEQITLIKAVAKLDTELYRKIFLELENNRDPQIVEILCASIQDYDADLERIVENWTKSGNAKVKKAALTAQRVLLKKKGSK